MAPTTSDGGRTLDPPASRFDPANPLAIPVCPEAGPVGQRVSPTRLVWEACGSQPHRDARHLPATFNGGDDRCWVCAAHSGMYGLPIVDWDGGKFTGQSRVKCPAGALICGACLWMMARLSPVPGRPAKPGQAAGPNWRNFSVCYAPGESLLIASKGEKPAIRAWLRRPHRGPWFAALADSGQKHVVPWAPVNGGGEGSQHRVAALFDERPVTLPTPGDNSPRGWGLLDATMALLTAGVTKEEIASGQYTYGALSRCEPAVRAYEAAHAAQRGSAWFDLAVWLAQRDEDAVQSRMAEEAATRVAKAARGKPAPR